MHKNKKINKSDIPIIIITKNTMNYVAAFTLPPVVMFASLSVVEKLYGFNLNRLKEDQKHAFLSLTSKIATVLILNVVPLGFILTDLIRYQKLNEWWVDYIIGCVCTINTSSMVWNMLVTKEGNPGSQIFFLYVLYYNVVTNPQTFLYYTSFMMAVFSVLRVSDDIYLLYTTQTLFFFNKYTRLAEEYGLYLFLLINYSNLSLVTWLVSALTLPWLYSNEITEYETFHVVNRKKTVLPSIENTIKNHPFMLTEAPS